MLEAFSAGQRVQLCTHLLTGAPRPQSAAVAALAAAYAAALAVLQVSPTRRLALSGYCVSTYGTPA